MLQFGHFQWSSSVVFFSAVGGKNQVQVFLGLRFLGSSLKGGSLLQLIFIPPLF
jgi:hypothetical protein